MPVKPSGVCDASSSRLRRRRRRRGQEKTVRDEQVECGESRDETLTRRLTALLTDSSSLISLSSLSLLPCLPRFARLAHPVDTDIDIGTIQLHQNTRYASILGSFLVQVRRNHLRAAGAHPASTPSRRYTP
jgi:hypothetical protein